MHINLDSLIADWHETQKPLWQRLLTQAIYFFLVGFALGLIYITIWINSPC